MNEDENGNLDVEVQVLTLPPLEIKPLSNGFISIHHILQAGGDFDVVSISVVRVSPRRSERVFHLSNNQSVIVTSKKLSQRPPNVDGVLYHADGQEPKWLFHVLKEGFEKSVLEGGFEQVASDISNSWEGQFSFSGRLRPPQIGSLHAIGAYWSTQSRPATVVLPTGTGKTETMLATLVAYRPGTTLVVVPSKALKDQTVKKFLTLGLLRFIGNLIDEAKNPIVGVVKRRPVSSDELEILKSCNVIVGTMSSLAEGTAEPLTPIIADKIDALMVDEAHHVPANCWREFREAFNSKKVLQFTATPYRRDGKLVDGKVIYEYPLHMAQEDGYFKNISFRPVHEIDDEVADEVVAQEAIKHLRSDLAAGHDHILMARCANLKRAEKILEIYERLASDLKPVEIDSESGDTATKEALGKISSRESRIVVCVNMLGEGYDLPQLKVAAVHDTHKSLAVLLQFTGRFTRTSGEAIGDATVVANIADTGISTALEKLYSEDADWNVLLSEFSSDAAKNHARLIEFLQQSQRLDPPKDGEDVEISNHLLRPVFSTLTYNAPKFEPKKFFEGLPEGMDIYRVWLNEQSNTLYFVTRTVSPTRWTRSSDVRDYQWNLFVIHYDPQRHLMYLASSDKSSLYESLAEKVGAADLISGDVIFKTLGRINRLIFQNIGVRKYGRRNLGYALYTGTDVATALSISEKSGSVKSNLSGTGWENGRPVSIGCSLKGRVWSREQGSIPEFIAWCESVGDKLQDASIDTTKIIENVLIPEEVTALPASEVLSIEWPLEILRQSEESITLEKGNDNQPISMFSIEFVELNLSTNQMKFQIRSVTDEIWGELALTVGGSKGFEVTGTTQPEITITVGAMKMSLAEYLSNYPPMVRFVDLSELDGNIMIKPQNPQELVFPNERLEAWDWSGVDLEKESIWKNGQMRTDSIQWKTAQQFIEGGFDLIFDDDSAGEAADLVCMKEEDDHVRLALIHCKFTSSSTAGARVKDVVEVSSQAVRSAKWKWKFKDLCRHIATREKKLSTDARKTRFLKGGSKELNRFVKVSRFKEIQPEIAIVQPGLSQSGMTPDQTAVLAAAYSYLKETIGADLDVICSE
jgi:superfamily II DNA or RNA helicase